MGFFNITQPQWVATIIKSKHEYAYCLSILCFNLTQPVRAVTANLYKRGNKLSCIGDEMLTFMDTDAIFDAAKAGDVPTKYAIEFCEWKDILSWKLAELSIAWYGLEFCLARVLWEMVFFGVEPEKMEKAVERIKNSLDEAKKELENDSAPRTFSYSKDGILYGHSTPRAKPKEFNPSFSMYFATKETKHWPCTMKDLVSIHTYDGLFESVVYFIMLFFGETNPLWKDLAKDYTEQSAYSAIPLTVIDESHSKRELIAKYYGEDKAFKRNNKEPIGYGIFLARASRPPANRGRERKLRKLSNPRTSLQPLWVALD